jgi:restriction endonuclease S subunit
MRTAMRPYPAYKDSGVDGLEQVPAHWQVGKLKYFAQINPSKSSSLFRDSEQLVTFLPMEKVGENGEIVTDLRKRVSELWNGFTYFERNDIILAKITPCFENGKGAYLHDLESGFGFGSTEFHVLREIRDKSVAKYLYYLTRSNPFRSSGEAFMIGAAGQKRIPASFVEDFILGIPPPDEQQAIANYLDRKTAAIDTLIAKKEQQIALLQEQRTAVINAAVTKGLNPNAPMKDSGIPWLDEIPAHWELKRLKHISPRILVGVVVNPSSYFDDKGTVPFFVGSNVSENHISTENVRWITEESNQKLAKSILYAGDLVVVRVGDPGVAAVVSEHLEGSNCASMMVVGKHPSFVPEYLCFVMNSKVGKSQVEIVQYGAAQKQFNISHAVDFVYPMPPFSEQQEIADYVVRKSAKFDDACNKVQKEIKLLQEYRTAVISAAVTGQIDVRQEA